MWTRKFWKLAAERAIKTGAQVAGSLLAVDGLGILDVDWPSVGSVTGLAVVASLVMSVASSRTGDPTDPSVVQEG